MYPPQILGAPPPTKKSCLYNCLCFNLLFCTSVYNTFRPHKIMLINCYVFLKYALKYAYLIVFMPPPPDKSDDLLFFFCLSANREMRTFLRTSFSGGGGGGLSAQNFSAPLQKPKASPVPPPPPPHWKNPSYATV